VEDVGVIDHQRSDELAFKPLRREEEWDMRLARIGRPGQEVPVASTGDDTWYDLRSIASDVDAELLAGGLGEVRAALAAGGLPALDTTQTSDRFGPPVANPGKIVCIGLNYRDHAAETGAQPPPEPIVFLKTPDTVVGAHDEVLVPRGSTKTDWEVELAVVVGREARYLEDDDAALACVAGYAISNDVSEREFQLERGGQWDKGKNCETFNPLGPWLVTADDVPDPQRLGLRLWVNGEPRQDGTTADMIFGVAFLVRYLSRFMVLRPGDVINTGTPAGVALGRPGTPFLRAGDVVELEIDGLGRQRQVLGQA
jgi:2-keto-4-pentenoate hydratase/2-oxohepta-3-ene-1,7-dioic acid hydratase in catechol pathway